MPKENAREICFDELVGQLRRKCRRSWFRPDKIWIYADPKCPHCDAGRMIHATAVNGQELSDYCRCGEHKRQVWTVAPYEVEVFVIPESGNRALEILPAKVDSSGLQVMSWWADPSPEGETHPDLMLYNSLFSSRERFEEYCRATGVPCLTGDMEVYT